MKKFEIEVEQIQGHCSCNYQQSDKFYCSGLNTPETQFCGGAYMILFPIIVALHSGSEFSFETNPYSKTKLACPDNGKVIFKITLCD